MIDLRPPSAHGATTGAAEIFQARNLIVDYYSSRQRHRALMNVSLKIAEGDSVGLIGESGSGKTTLSRVLLGMIKPSEGQVLYRGRDIYRIGRAARHRMLGRDAAMVFQDPRSSLNPRFSVGAVVRDPLHVQQIGKRHEQNQRVAELLESVGLSPELASRPVRALSGGQLQRVALARALAVEPSIIVADEPTSALDVSVQAQILNLLQYIRGRDRLALLVVSHDMRVIRFLADRTAVMYQGQIVEAGPTEQVYEDPQHNYTKTLLASMPRLSRAGRSAIGT